ncbi:MAG: right-handed parallel beta-helix repeat-containing protein [Bacteroidales bacterium]
MIPYLHKALLLTLAILALHACTDSGRAGHRTFYVSNGGDDQNSGRTAAESWKTIDKINQMKFSPGDLILFKSGEEYTGTLTLSAEDSGTEENRIRISSFGDGKPVINGINGEALHADSCDFLTVENLVLKGSGRLTGNITDGLLVRNCKAVVLDHLEVYGFQHNGVHLYRCNNARITHVYAHENGFAGIHVTGSTMRDPENYDNHNLYIGYCVAENNPGDPTVLENHSGNGILASSVKGGVIEYCEAFNNGWDMVWTGNGPVGIWIWDCTEFTIQYCIAHHNRTNPVAADGGGFDFDGGVSSSVIQYCIAHHNEGAGFGLYEFGSAKPWENNTVRYNLSLDDGIINGGSVGIWKNDDRGVMRNCQIYNNTFYNSQDDGNNLWIYDHYPGFQFRNNVFVYNGALIAEDQGLEEEVFQGNLYWNLGGSPSFFGYPNLGEWAQASGKETLNGSLAGIYGDPLFENAGSLELTDPEKISMAALSGFFPGQGSPLIDAGIDLREQFSVDPGEKDLVGTTIPVNLKYDIGAIEALK